MNGIIVVQAATTSVAPRAVSTAGPSAATGTGATLASSTANSGKSSLPLTGRNARLVWAAVILTVGLAAGAGARMLRTD